MLPSKGLRVSPFFVFLVLSPASPLYLRPVSVSLSRSPDCLTVVVGRKFLDLSPLLAEYLSIVSVSPFIFPSRGLRVSPFFAFLDLSPCLPSNSVPVSVFLSRSPDCLTVVPGLRFLDLCPYFAEYLSFVSLSPFMLPSKGLRVSSFFAFLVLSPASPLYLRPVSVSLSRSPDCFTVVPGLSLSDLRPSLAVYTLYTALLVVFSAKLSPSYSRLSPLLPTSARSPVFSSYSFPYSLSPHRCREGTPKAEGRR